MSLFKRGKIYWYEFEVDSVRHRRSTKQIDRAAAEQVELEAMKRARRRAAGIEVTTETPSFSAWAETCRSVKRKRLRRLDVWERTMRVVLAFWGAKPQRRDPVEGGVYHNLQLADPINNPEWIEQFEQWMQARGIAASTKLSYWSALSGMYRIAMRPRYRKLTGVTINPFTDVDRERPKKRRVSLSPEHVRAWIQVAAPHARIALVIGALASKLRLDQVLALDFNKHFDRELRMISFDEYKTVDSNAGEQQITPVGDDLREVLLELRRVRPGSSRVITFRGRPVKSIRRATQTAAKSAGLKWGMKGGVTFHVLRKVFASEAAILGLGEALVSKALDHKDQRTTRQHYTHVEALKQKPVFDAMAAHLKLKQSALLAVGVLVGSDAKRERRLLAKRRSSRSRVA